MFFRKKKETAPPPPEIQLSVPEIEPLDSGGPRKKILVIDDDPIIVKTLTMTLTANGYKVVSAADASAGLSIMRQEKPDLMLVDITFPPDVSGGGIGQWDGFQVTRWLQQTTNKRTPTIIISGSNKPEYTQKALEAGADGFLPKPIDKQLLLETIAKALATNRGEKTDAPS
jgi:two-component system KDP operon response regulator KdpE